MELRNKSHHQPKNAVLMAMFGTTVEPALNSLLLIQRKIQEYFPATPVRISFTSNIIRKIWQKRALDPVYVSQHKNIPAEIMHIRGPLAAMADLHEAGYDTLVVQPTLIDAGEEFHDLTNYVKALDSIETIKEKYKPFKRVVIGRPALGSFGPRHPYSLDIETAARRLSADAALAKQKGAALVYMGHGNNYFPSGGSYLEFAERMRQLYPDVLTVIGCVEGFPSRREVTAQLQMANIQKVLLKPFMIAAGIHTIEDMAGDEPNSWKSTFTAAGYTVITISKGLGENAGFAKIFAEHAADAALDAGIDLK
ncbi:MAG TPA: sirohydrochlorin cobaltochelatase [Desulfobacterales bacterium]|nr:sirohydrochlorin cobaltochelatase [Desulfobacterales bacterium]